VWILGFAQIKNFVAAATQPAREHFAFESELLDKD
jgi:hypothetical protein